MINLDVAAIKEGAARQVAMELLNQAASVLDRHGVMRPLDRTALRLAWKTIRPKRWPDAPPAVLSEGGVGPA